MNRKTRLPIINSKENRAGLCNRQPTTRNAVNILSDDEKRSLILNHTKPIRPGANSNVAASSIAPAPRLKRSATAPTTINVPTKVCKVDKKVAPKIPPYDYKARFNDLLEKHKVMKSELIDLKDKHVEVSDDYEKIKGTIQSCTSEKDILKEKLLNTLNDLKEKVSEFNRIKTDYDIQKHENEELQRKAKLLEDITINLKQKSLELDKVKSDYDELYRHHNSLKEETEALRALTHNLKKISIEYDKLKLDYKEAQDFILKYKTEAEALQNILANMYKEQRDLRNTIQDLKGNIRVYCRVRPPLESEASKPLFNLNVLDACSIEVEKFELNLNSARKGKSLHSFSFDGIFTPHASQEDVFAEVSSMVQSALDGYNVCIFAYGQTGSGKTYTMEGGCGTEQYGIIPRAFNMIFTCMEDLKRMGWELSIKASFLEIYNEVIYDLLNSCKDQENHEIKMVNSKGNDVYVSNLKEEEVKSSHDFIRLMIFAQRNRQTAATINNERSSRSHSVAQIKISAVNEKRKERYTSNLNLVDLAGSESGKTTQRMDETKHINRSLSELSKVILSLQTNQSHIPYRNSKLTHLLMPSLGGNSKTLMLVNINQFDECFSETLNSLRFATKVNNCRIVKAKKNLSMYDI
ncbi:hypothetical protein K1T71_003993 [Dendrolimus kikuchii]|uniref:Uncharacterized protein n=1 Tax=Dendrolimus kikuchii TaxID=765133 RepID=A0ACC1D9F4_9NEOP|nr:hypothetical protein K1T71_003993 [Dendrolimus kikuchii]